MSFVGICHVSRITLFCKTIHVSRYFLPCVDCICVCGVEQEMRKLCVKLQMMAPDLGLSQICPLSMIITGFELCNLISFKEFHCVNMFTCLFFLEKKLFFRFTIVQKKFIFLSL